MLQLTKHEALFKKYKRYLATAESAPPKTVYTLGPLTLNYAVGTQGGLKGGHFVQVFGKSGTGKSSLALDGIRQWQERNQENDAMYVNTERSFDKDYAAALGVDLQRLYIVNTDYTEQSLDIVEAALDGGIKFFVIDSVAAGMPKAEQDKSNDENAKMASNALLWTRFCNRNVARVDNADALVILNNQLRKSFSTMSREEFMPAGGMALGFYSNVNIALSRIGTQGDHITIRAEVKKNRQGKPAQVVDYSIIYGRGIDHQLNILTTAVNFGVIERSGSWYRYKEQRVQGLEAAKDIFPVDEIKELVLRQLKETPEVATIEEESL